MQSAVGIYIRVSSRTQSTRSQEPDLQKWVKAFADDRPVQWFRDKATGTTMDRPAWKRLEAAIDRGEIGTLIVWRLDRLGRLASGLALLFDKLIAKKVNLISLRDGVDLSTPAGRLTCNILASIAAFETEVRGERARAGIQAARDRGIKWGGSPKGRRHCNTRSKEAAVRRLRAQGMPITQIARSVGLGRQTVYNLLNEPPKSTAE